MKATKFFTLSIYLIIFCAISTNAQKLPAVQEGGVRASLNVKIDGKLSDWKGGFKAYSKSTGLYYTIANDDSFIYFSLMVSDPVIQKKVLKGGLSVNLKNSNKNVVVDLPLLSEQQSGQIATTINSLIEAKEALKKDTLISLANRQLSAALKEIGVKGITGINTPTISVFNNHGIKYWMELNSSGALVCEVAIKLSHLSDNTVLPFSLSYEVKSNGILNKTKVIMLDGSEAPPDAGMVVIGSSVNGKTSDVQFLNSDTSFKGVYPVILK